MIGKNVEADKERQLAGYWLGIEILDRLANAGDRLTSAEVAALLGVRNVKGIGRALSQTRESLALSGIRFDEAVHRRAVGGRTEWFAGPRIRQARHVLEHQRRFWTGNPADVPVADVGSGHAGGVLVLRALTTNGTVYRIDGGMAELDAILDDDWFDRDDEGLWSIGEVSIHRIETADGGSRPVPEGYGENGIWIRGHEDYVDPRVPGAIGTGRNPSMLAWIGNARWVQRRIALVDAVEQVEAVRAGRLFLDEQGRDGWRNVHGDRRYRHVRWIGGLRDGLAPRRTPPLRMRLRCWYEIVVSNARGVRTILREEGLRGDTARTTDRALDRWRSTRAENSSELLLVNEVRIAKRQPRPMPPK
ncbi:MAG: hypothetical protein OXU77_18640 [Gammaproteobacteria bacterium]|nr:hypothetical protein [Gammaproteobacteria bacterium]